MIVTNHTADPPALIVRRQWFAVRICINQRCCRWLLICLRGWAWRVGSRWCIGFVDFCLSNIVKTLTQRKINTYNQISSDATRINFIHFMLNWEISTGKSSGEISLSKISLIVRSLKELRTDTITKLLGTATTRKVVSLPSVSFSANGRQAWWLLFSSERYCVACWCVGTDSLQKGMHYEQLPRCTFSIFFLRIDYKLLSKSTTFRIQ